MASQFQNRLVGPIVLVALGVIVLPGLLDGQKIHYQDEFAAIPLVPKAGDLDEPDMMPASTQALPTQPPEGAAEEVRAGDAAAPSLDPLEGPRGATAEQLLEHLGNGKSFDSVAQAWDAAMADAKAEDTVLVCGSFHTVAHVMEVIDARRSGGKSVSESVSGPDRAGGAGGDCTSRAAGWAENTLSG